MKKIFARKEMSVAALIVVMTLAIGLRAPSFLRFGNLIGVVGDTSVLAIVSLAQLGVILIGGIDLSVASTMALAGMIVALTNQHNPQIPAWVYLPMSLGIGAALGAVNGVLVAWGRLPPIVASLGTMSIYRGAVFLISKGQWVTAHEMSVGFRRIPEGKMLGLPYMLWIAAAIALFYFILMRYTRSGRDVYAFGGNASAARYAGVNERKVEMLVFVVSGALAALAGLIYVSRYGIAQSETATGYELNTVAAAVLGGVNIAGGSGTVLGVLLGSLFIGIVNNALPVLRMSPFLEMLIQGIIILTAVVANTVADMRAKKSLSSGRRL